MTLIANVGRTNAIRKASIASDVPKYDAVTHPSPRRHFHDEDHAAHRDHRREDPAIDRPGAPGADLMRVELKRSDAVSGAHSATCE